MLHDEPSHGRTQLTPSFPLLPKHASFFAAIESDCLTISKIGGKNAFVPCRIGNTPDIGNTPSSRGITPCIGDTPGKRREIYIKDVDLMDAFESVVATILERNGFWVRTSLKVELTKEEKREIGRPSSPRWEIDVVGYRPGDNVLRIVECKSYLDSRGVSLVAFDPSTRFANRFKLFNETTTREVVFRRLVAQLSKTNAIQDDPTIELCLAAGKIVASDADGVRSLFDANGWLLFDPDWLRERLRHIAADGYDNAIAAVTAKLLLR